MRLGELEAEVMERLWRWDRPSTVRDVVKRLIGADLGDAPDEADSV